MPEEGENNPEAACAIVRNRAARKREAEGIHTAEEIEALKNRQRNKCANPICRASLRSGYHADHIVPLVRGESNWIKNIQLLCASCNQRKGRSDPIEWAQQNGMLL